MSVKFKSNIAKYLEEQLEQKFPGFKEIACQDCDSKAKRVDRDHFKCNECGAVIRLEISDKE